MTTLSEPPISEDAEFPDAADKPPRISPGIINDEYGFDYEDYGVFAPPRSGVSRPCTGRGCRSAAPPGARQKLTRPSVRHAHPEVS